MPPPDTRKVCEAAGSHHASCMLWIVQRECQNVTILPISTIFRKIPDRRFCFIFARQIGVSQIARLTHRFHMSGRDCEGVTAFQCTQVVIDVQFQKRERPEVDFGPLLLANYWAGSFNSPVNRLATSGTASASLAITTTSSSLIF